MFRNIFKKDGPPIVLQVYVDGRAEIYVPKPRTARSVALSQLLQKGLAEKEIRVTEPGRYHFNYTKVGTFGVEAELTPIK